MNIEQRKQVISWAFVAFFLILMIIFSDEVLENWKIIRFPILLFILVIAYILEPYDGYRRDPKWIGKVSEKYPWIKIWLVFYSIFLAMFIYDSLSNKRDLLEFMDGVWVLIAFFLLILPLAIASERNKFILNGKKNIK